MAGLAFAVAAVFAVGAKTGSALEYRHLQKKVRAELAAIQAGADQCGADISAQNESIAAQARNALEARERDLRRREAAMRAQSAYNAELEARYSESIQILSQIQKGLEDASFDDCTSSPVDPDLVRMLNAAIAGLPDGKAGLPGADGQD